MSTLHLVLLVGSLVCFLLAAWRAANPDWNKLVAVGLVLLTASFISW